MNGEGPARAQDRSLPTSSRAQESEEDSLSSVPSKKQCTSNNSRSHKEIWRERCLRENIDKSKKKMCSCNLRCVEKMSIGDIFRARCLNSDRSADELRGEIKRKLMSYRNSDGKFSFKTGDGVSCCRVGFEVEQGVHPSFITNCYQALESGVIQGPRRGGKHSL